MPDKPICPFCRFPIKEGSRFHRCSRCEILHHSECWRENGGCSTYGCRSRPNSAAAQPLPVVCPSCGESNRDRDRVCWACSAALPRPVSGDTSTTPATVPPPPPAESLPDQDLPEQEMALRQEAVDALLAVQSALEIGVTAEKYGAELLKAKQNYDRLKIRSAYADAGVFWLMAGTILLKHRQALSAWQLRFQFVPGTNQLCSHIAVASEFGKSLLKLYPSLESCIQKRNIWTGPSEDQWAIDDVLQAIWVHTSEDLGRLRVCLRK